MDLKNKTNTPKIISLFSGCGGLGLGLHKEGYDTIWANVFSEWAISSFCKYFGDVITLGDITKTDPCTDKPIFDCDLILGGFPCEDFSVIWKQPGLDGKRGGLYRDFLEHIDAKKPKEFVAKNVIDILTANHRKAIKTITEEMG